MVILWVNMLNKDMQRKHLWKQRGKCFMSKPKYQHFYNYHMFFSFETNVEVLKEKSKYELQNVLFYPDVDARHKTKITISIVFYSILQRKLIINSHGPRKNIHPGMHKECQLKLREKAWKQKACTSTC